MAGDVKTPPGLTADEIVDSRYEMRFPEGGYSEKAECIRGEAKPWFTPDNPKLASHAFKRVTDIAALEVAVLDSGNTLEVVNWGCEYFAVRLRYDFTDPPRSLSDRGWWYRKTAEAISTARKLGADPIFDLDLAAKQLETLAGSNPPPGQANEYPVEGDGISFLQTHLSVGDSGPSTDGLGGYVEVDLFKGPL
ncbi:MAG: hypothetical protein PVJ01_02730 [Pseudomonadota bacterium]